MEFKELYQKYLAGECTPEEKAFVEEEIRRAQIVSDELFKEHKPVEFTPVSDEEVIKAKKSFETKTLIKTVIISIVICIIVAGIGAATVFGLAIHGARTNTNYNTAEAETAVSDFIKEYAAEHMTKHLNGGEVNITYIYQDGRDLQMRFPLSRCYYIYEYEARASGYEFEIEFNTKTGECVITDVDRD